MGIFRISQPVVDLCSKPDVEFPSDYSHQEYRETQLLYGEAVSILDSERGWLKIGALEQPVFDKHVGWRPYIGWIKDSQVKAQVKAQVKKSLSLSPSHVVIRSEQFSFGTWIGTQQAGARLLPTKPCRHTLVADAHLFFRCPLPVGRALLLLPIDLKRGIKCGLLGSDQFALPRARDHPPPQLLRSVPKRGSHTHTSPRRSPLFSQRGAPPPCHFKNFRHPIYRSP